MSPRESRLFGSAALCFLTQEAKRTRAGQVNATRSAFDSANLK